MAAGDEEAGIYLAFIRKLQNFEADPDPVPVAWEDKKFTPPGAGQMWIEPQHMPNRPDELFLSYDENGLAQGLFQVTVNQEKKTGDWPYDKAAALHLAGQVCGHFAQGTYISTESGDVVVRVYRQPWASTPMKEGDRLVTPVTIPYRSTE